MEKENILNEQGNLVGYRVLSEVEANEFVLKGALYEKQKNKAIVSSPLSMKQYFDFLKIGLSLSGYDVKKIKSEMKDEELSIYFTYSVKIEDKGKAL